MRCGACGTDNDAGAKFCMTCGTVLAVTEAIPLPPAAADRDLAAAGLGGYSSGGSSSEEVTPAADLGAPPADLPSSGLSTDTDLAGAVPSSGSSSYAPPSVDLPSSTSWDSVSSDSSATPTIADAGVPVPSSAPAWNAPPTPAPSVDASLPNPPVPEGAAAWGSSDQPAPVAPPPPSWGAPPAEAMPAAAPAWTPPPADLSAAPPPPAATPAWDAPAAPPPPVAPPPPSWGTPAPPATPPAWGQAPAAPAPPAPGAPAWGVSPAPAPAGAWGQPQPGLGQPAPSAGLVDPHGLGVAATRLGGSPRKHARVALAVAGAKLEEGEMVEAVVAGRFEGNPAVLVLTNQGLLLADERQWRPVAERFAVDAGLQIQGWQDDRTASLTLVLDGRQVVIDGINDRPLAVEMAQRVRYRISG